MVLIPSCPFPAIPHDYEPNLVETRPRLVELATWSTTLLARLTRVAITQNNYASRGKSGSWIPSTQYDRVILTVMVYVNVVRLQAEPGPRSTVVTAIRPMMGIRRAECHTFQKRNSTDVVEIQGITQ